MKDRELNILIKLKYTVGNAFDRVKATVQKSVESATNYIRERYDKATDAIKNKLKSVGDAISGFASRSRERMSRIFDLGANLNGWVQVISGAVNKVVGVFAKGFEMVKMAFNFETYLEQFAVLLGSMDKAKKHMSDLNDFAAETPFELDGIVKASRTLITFSEGALGGKDSLTLVGDAAAALNTDFESLAFYVGRLYAAVKGGSPMGEMMMRLQEIGAVTPKVRKQMEDLQASGGSVSAIWAVFTEHLEKNAGAMENLSKTGNGLLSTLEDNWNQVKRTFGEVFTSLTKDTIEKLLVLIDKLQNSGEIEKFGESVKKAVEPFKDAVFALTNAEGRSTVWTAFKANFTAIIDYFSASVKSAFDYGGALLTDAIKRSLPASFGGYDSPNLSKYVRDTAETKYNLARIANKDNLKAVFTSSAKSIKDAAEKAMAEAQKAVNDKKQIVSTDVETDKEKVAKQLAEADKLRNLKSEEHTTADMLKKEQDVAAKLHKDKISALKKEMEGVKGVAEVAKETQKEALENLKSASEKLAYDRRLLDDKDFRQSEKEKNRNEQKIERKWQLQVERVQRALDNGIDEKRLTAHQRRILATMRSHDDFKKAEDYAKQSSENLKKLLAEVETQNARLNELLTLK